MTSHGGYSQAGSVEYRLDAIVQLYGPIVAAEMYIRIEIRAQLE